MKVTTSREDDLQRNGGGVEDAKSYEDQALKVLRNSGYRITMPRVQVIRALANTSRALSAYAIHEKIISGGGKIDVVSVYRILSTLQEVGLIHHIGVVDGYFPCRLTDCAGKRSEVIVDQASGAVTELRVPEEVVRLLEEQAASSGHEAVSIKIEITGTGK